MRGALPARGSRVFSAQTATARCSPSYRCSMINAPPLAAVGVRSPPLNERTTIRRSTPGAELSISQSRSRLANTLRGPLVIDVGQVVKEPMAATEVLGDLRGELLVHGLGGLLGGRLLEGRRVHE